MSCARIARLSLAAFVFFALAFPVFGQEMSAEGCGLPAVVQGIDVGEVCNKLGVSYRSIYGPDRSPWIEIASASDCDRVRAELDRVLSGQAQAAPPESGAEPPPSETPAPPAWRETDLERWLRRNGYASLDQAQADSAAVEKKWKQDRQTQEQSVRKAFAEHMRRFAAELRERLTRQEALVAAELERRKQAAESVSGAIPAEAWEQPLAKWRAELDKANHEVEATRQALLKLVKAQQADVKLFDEWEREAQEGFERSKSAIIDLALDLGMGLFVESPDGWAAYARGLQAKATPEALREYQKLHGLIQRLKEAKATREFAALAAKEGKTEAEFYEMLRDGIGQLSGLFGVDETLPGKVWKYGSLFFDQAYNYTALYQVWKNAGILEQDSAAMSEAIQRLSERLRRQQERQQELVKKIEVGEKLEFKN
jgi:hypothetical protein